MKIQFNYNFKKMKASDFAEFLGNFEPAQHENIKAQFESLEVIVELDFH